MKPKNQNNNTELEIYAPTIDEQLRRWDAGQTIFTIELGGLGPGYEQAIQIAAIEFSRKCKDLKELKSNDEASTEKFTKCCDEVLNGINDKLGGLSGAQFGAARWLAWQWCFQSNPKDLIERAKKQGKQDQVIQCSKYFPSVPTEATT